MPSPSHSQDGKQWKPEKHEGKGEQPLQLVTAEVLPSVTPSRTPKLGTCSQPGTRGPSSRVGPNGPCPPWRVDQARAYPNFFILNKFQPSASFYSPNPLQWATARLAASSQSPPGRGLCARPPARGRTHGFWGASPRRWPLPFPPGWAHKREAHVRILKLDAFVNLQQEGNLPVSRSLCKENKGFAVRHLQEQLQQHILYSLQYGKGKNNI